MAYFESLATFSTNQTVTATADATNLFDVTGAGVGNAPSMIGAGGLKTAIGIDIGSGDIISRPHLYIAIPGTSTGSGTITFTLAAAPDNGSYSAGTYTTIYQSAAFVASTLVTGVLQVPVPPIAPNEALPRFYKLTYTVTGTVSVIVGTAALLLNPPNVRGATLFGNNFVSV